ncbi:hypothetical protein [Actinokineospora sp. HUAS TT18]|uniref:hypothetical protein n=1 Tax=Actinokineospora sp. HUAS TT18 TaxID=3447451 RepID=UPI003F526145
MPVLIVLGLPGGYTLLTSATFTRPLSFLILAGAMTIVICVVIRHRFASCRLPWLIDAGEWTRVEVRVSRWEARQDLTVDTHLAIRRADGAILSARMRAATGDLVTAVAETGVLWVAGEPAPGRTVAVGYPGYPLLTVARIS